MRHKVAHRKFDRSPAHRRAMFRNMATSFLKEERIETTVEKAKDLRGVVERLITLGKKDDLHARRKAYGYLFNKAVVHKLFTDLGPRFKDRPGGYTRVIRTRRRAGDTAEMAYIELVDRKVVKPAPKKKSAKEEAAALPDEGARKVKSKAKEEE